MRFGVELRDEFVRSVGLGFDEFVHQLADAQIDRQQQLLRRIVPGKQLRQGDGFDCI